MQLSAEHEDTLTVPVLTGTLLASLFSFTGVAPMPTGSPLPLQTMHMPAVLQRIDLAVDSKCNGLPAAQKDWGPTDWASLARFEMRCGDRQRGLTQARIYAGAVLTIESILYLMPDAYGSAAWRKIAQQLISQALPAATQDRELAALLRSMALKVGTGARQVDLKPSADDVAPQKLAPPEAMQIGSSQLEGVDVTEIWFSLHTGLAAADRDMQAHLRNMGWELCFSQESQGPHDEIIVNNVGQEDPHIPRIADRHFYASLRNEWEITTLLYDNKADPTDVVLRVSKVDSSPLCTPSPK